MFQISTFCVDSKSWQALGYVRLDIDVDEFDRGGMRVVRKATIIENCDHPLLQQFTNGMTVLTKQYIADVVQKVEESNRSIISIAKKVIY